MTGSSKPSFTLVLIFFFFLMLVVFVWLVYEYQIAELNNVECQLSFTAIYSFEKPINIQL